MNLALNRHRWPLSGYVQNFRKSVRSGSAARALSRQALAPERQLAAGQAVTLQFPESGELHITHGRVWLTFGPGPGRNQRTGDHFPGRGDTVSLSAHEAVVLEPVGLGDVKSASFRWVPEQA